jgi:hypothetical protein
LEVAGRPAAAESDSRRRYALPAVLIAGVAARVLVVLLAAPDSDVYYYLRDAVHAVLAGMNPYNTTYTGIPSNLATAGVGHIFAYFPFTVLYLVPFGALDIRVGMIVADVAIAALLYAYGGRPRLASAAVYLLLPPTVLFSTVYLNATLVAMVFVALWLVLESRGRTLEGAACLGLALASSQFSFLILPFALVYYLRATRWKEPLVALAVAAAVVAPFLVAGPGMFVSETLSFQFERGVTALYATGGPAGFTFSPSLSSLLMAAFGVTAPPAAKAIVEVALAALLIRVGDLRSMLRSSFLFALASVFVLPNSFFWAYLELPFMLLLFWLGTGAERGAAEGTTMPKI